MRHGSYLPTHARSSGSCPAHAHVSCIAHSRMHHHGSYPAHAHIHTPWRLYDRLLMQCFTCESCQARDYHAHAHADTHAMLLWGQSHIYIWPWQPACPCIYTPQAAFLPMHIYIYMYMRVASLPIGTQRAHAHHGACAPMHALAKRR